MRKSFLIIFIVIFVGILTLLAQPRARHIIITGVITFPEFAFMQSMRGGLVTRDFDRVMPWLYKQYELADSYGGEKNRLTPGLLENIKKAYDVAVLEEERQRFIDILEKVYLLNPQNIDLNIMLASAYLSLDKNQSFTYLEKARKILPSDQRIFHLANIMLRSSKDLEKKQAWCKAYKSSQFGDYDEYRSVTLLGTGYRRIALEFSKGTNRNLYLNEGLQIGERIKYEFILDEQEKLVSPSLRVAVGGGIGILVHKIELFSKGRLVQSYDDDSILLYPETGYFINGQVVSLNLQGENIFIEAPNISSYPTDKVVLELTIDKLALNNSTQCDS